MPTESLPEALSIILHFLVNTAHWQ